MDRPAPAPPIGNPQSPTSPGRVQPSGWYPGMRQNQEPLRAQVKPWPAITKPAPPFRLR